MNIDELTIYQDEISRMLLKVQNFTFGYSYVYTYTSQSSFRIYNVSS